MKLKNTLFIAAQTNRSKSYAQALQVIGIEITNILLLGDEREINETDNNIDVKSKIDKDNNELFFADYSIPLQVTCEKLSKEIYKINTTKINDPGVLDIVRKLKPELVIYSGFGGQIVSADLLSVCPFLHVHAGLLPEYRGSTTIYYSILNERKCGVTSILLQPEIDTGSIIYRKEFPLPNDKIDIDHHYDGAIRASVLIDSLKLWNSGDIKTKLSKQDESKSETYYVIHPVLKHLAILSLSTER